MVPLWRSLQRLAVAFTERIHVVSGQESLGVVLIRVVLLPRGPEALQEALFPGGISHDVGECLRWTASVTEFRAFFATMSPPAPLTRAFQESPSP